MSLMTHSDLIDVLFERNTFITTTINANCLARELLEELIMHVILSISMIMPS